MTTTDDTSAPRLQGSAAGLEDGAAQRSDCEGQVVGISGLYLRGASHLCRLPSLCLATDAAVGSAREDEASSSALSSFYHRVSRARYGVCGRRPVNSYALRCGADPVIT